MLNRSTIADLTRENCERSTAPFARDKPHTILILSLVTTLTCLVLSTASTALAQDVVGSIIEVNGTAEVERGGQSLNAVPAMAIKLHDKLHTMSGAHLTIAISNRAQLTLTGSTTILINGLPMANEKGSNFRVDLSGGDIRCTVAVGSLTASPGFEIRAPNAIAVAHGTEFETLYIEGKSCPDSPPCHRYTDVSVYKGIVEVSNPTDPETPAVQVGQGYQTAVPCELPPTSPAPLVIYELGTPGYQ